MSKRGIQTMLNWLYGLFIRPLTPGYSEVEVDCPRCGTTFTVREED